MAEAVHRNVFHVRSLPQLKLSLRLSFSAHSNLVSANHLAAAICLSVCLSLSLSLLPWTERVGTWASWHSSVRLLILCSCLRKRGRDRVSVRDRGERKQKDRSKMAANCKPPLCSWNVCQKNKKIKWLCWWLIPGLKCSLHERNRNNFCWKQPHFYCSDSFSMENTYKDKKFWSEGPLNHQHAKDITPSRS